MLNNRKTVTSSLAVLGLVGVAGGGLAWSASGASTPATLTTSHCGAAYGMAFGTHAPMDAVAKYVGLSRAEISTQMRAGSSLADIAKGQGKDVAGLRAAMYAAMRQSLAGDTKLTHAQRTAILTLMMNRVDTMMTGADTSGMDLYDMGSGMMGSSGNTMMSGSGSEMMGGTGNGMMGD